MMVYAGSVVFSQTFAIAEQCVHNLFFQLRYRIKGNENVSPYLRLVSIDEKDTEVLDIAKNDRTVFGRMINILSASDPALVVMDFIFKADPHMKGDKELVDSTRKAGNIFYPVILSEENHSELTWDKNTPLICRKMEANAKVSHKNDTLIYYNIDSYPFRDLALAAEGLGDISLQPDSNKLVVRIPLFFAFHDGFMPSLILTSICHFLNVKQDDIEIYFGKYIKLGNAEYPDGDVKDLFIPIDDKGAMAINYYGPSDIYTSSFPVRKLFKDFSDEDSKDKLLFKFKSSFVIVADTNTKNDGDFFKGVFNETVSHSEILLNGINTILTKNFLYEPGAIERILVALLLVLLLWIASVKRLYLPVSFLFILFIVVNFLLFCFFNRLTILLPDSIAFFLSLILLVIYARLPAHAYVVQQDLNVQTSGNKKNVQRLVDNNIIAVTADRTKTSMRERGVIKPLQGNYDIPEELQIKKYILQKKYKDVIELILKGYEYKEIGVELNMSINTVKKKIQKIYRECGVQNKIELFNLFKR
jgi:DNA-binding CsgD family transcriptional regulator